MNIEKSIADTRAKIERKKRLEWNEKQIFASMANIAGSLRDIHANKLWQDDFATLEEYCEKRLRLTRQRVHQIINAENTRLLLSDGAEPEVATAVKKLNNGQAAELNGIPKEQAVEILKDAMEQPGKMTAKKIKQAKARVVDPKPVEDPVLDDGKEAALESIQQQQSAALADELEREAAYTSEMKQWEAVSQESITELVEALFYLVDEVEHMDYHPLGLDDAKAILRKHGKEIQ